MTIAIKPEEKNLDLRMLHFHSRMDDGPEGFLLSLPISYDVFYSGKILPVTIRRDFSQAARWLSDASQNLSGMSDFRVMLYAVECEVYEHMLKNGGSGLDYVPDAEDQVQAFMQSVRSIKEQAALMCGQEIVSEIEGVVAQAFIPC